MIKKKLKLMFVMLLNGWIAVFGMRFIEKYSQILFIAGMISFIYSMILSVQIIRGK